MPAFPTRACALVAFPAALLAAAVACGDDGGPRRVPASIEQVGDVPRATVNTVAPDASVRVTDASSQPVAGVRVAFTLESGDGALTGPTTAFTDGAGVATLTGWRLAREAGLANRVAARAGSSVAQVLALGLPGPYVAIQRLPQQPDSFAVAAASIVLLPPAVRTVDEFGNAAPGGLVQFALGAAGPGSAIAGALQASDQGGVARLGGWRVGSQPGRETLLAQRVSATGVASGAVHTFVAVVEPCAQRRPYVAGSPAVGALGPTDCTFNDGSWVDLWSLDPTAPLHTEFRMSAAFNSFLLAYRPDGNIAALRDDAYGADAALRLVAPPGAWVLGANSLNAQVAGPYSLSSTNDHSPACNQWTFVRPSFVTGALLTATDCDVPRMAGTTKGDDYFIILTPGERIALTAASAVIDPVIEVRTTPTTVIAVAEPPGTNDDARLTFGDPAQPTLYQVRVRMGTFGDLGAYSLGVQADAPTPALRGDVLPAPRAAHAQAAAQLAALRAQLARFRTPPRP